MRILIWLISSIIILFTGCKAYRFDYKRQHIVVPNYNSADTLLLSGYVLCNSLRNDNKLNSEVDFGEGVNLDSVFDIFKTSISKLNLPIKFYENENRCDSSFRANWRMKIDETNSNISRVKVIDTSNVIQIIPVVHLTNFYQKHIYVSGGVFGGGHYIKQTILRVMIYVVKGDEIIYLKSAKYFGETYHSNNPKETRTNLEQEHWDKLVELVMRDYIKRLK
jgi:hypothetical protein